VSPTSAADFLKNKKLPQNTFMRGFKNTPQIPIYQAGSARGQCVHGASVVVSSLSCCGARYLPCRQAAASAIDRCQSLRSLALPPAALPSLPRSVTPLLFKFQFIELFDRCNNQQRLNGKSGELCSQSLLDTFSPVRKYPKNRRGPSVWSSDSPDVQRGKRHRFYKEKLPTRFPLCNPLGRSCDSHSSSIRRSLFRKLND